MRVRLCVGRTHRQRSLGLIRLQRGMLRDHGFDKYEGALAALCPVERRRDGLPS